MRRFFFYIKSNKYYHIIAMYVIICDLTHIHATFTPQINIHLNKFDVFLITKKTSTTKEPSMMAKRGCVKWYLYLTQATKDNCQ